MHSYFISYSWKDFVAADQIELFLLRRDRIVMRDETYIKGGDDLDDVVKEMICKSDTFICLISMSYVGGYWGPKELEFAKTQLKGNSRLKRIIPFQLSNQHPSRVWNELSKTLWISAQNRTLRKLAVAKAVDEEH